jgi:hypothetical protein
MPLTFKGYLTVSSLKVCMFCNKKTDVYIYTILCQDTIVGDKELPLNKTCIFENIIAKWNIYVSLRFPQVHDVTHI